jgi:hypothetical protein
MAPRPPVAIPFPLSSFPGSNPQESEGRLINCYADPLGEGGKRFKWIRSAGLSPYASTANGGYRGGLLVKNLSYVCWANNASTCDAGGSVTSIGSFPGTKPVSIARNQASPRPDVVAVDLDNGAYCLGSASGTYFSGTPTLYTGSGILPQPNSVCFQDGYFFFTVQDGQVFATGLNALTMNALTTITVQAKADVSLLRAIAFSGLLFLFTTGSCEVWQDAANPAPNFPYSRLAVLEFGLAQSTAIAGWETGFSELLWVAQDFGVHWMPAAQLSQIKASPPDLDRLIEAAIRAGQQLWASAYVIAGKKFWVLSSPGWTWEFNLTTRKWSERWSLTPQGAYGAWRAAGGHPAFGGWTVGDTQSGALLQIDDTTPYENGTPVLWRVESGLVQDFPEQERIARADFDFVVGVGQEVGSIATTVLGSAAGTSGLVRLKVGSTVGMSTGDVVSVAGVVGTTEANGNWTINVIGEAHIDLQGTVYANAYTSGGTVVDLTSPPNEQNPQVAISMSKDGGVTWGNPLMRPLGTQANALRSRVSVLNQGLTGPMGTRWRLDITDPVYASLMGATQSSETRIVGT